MGIDVIPFYGVLRVAWLVEALCYKPESCGFDSRCHWIFQLTLSFQPYYSPGIDSTQSPTDMITRNFLWDKGRPARKADNLTANCKPIVEEI
jgi:hypothetical protein